MSEKERLSSNQAEQSNRFLNNKVGGYCFRKTTHPRNKEEGQGWEESEIADTLNIFDFTELRTPILIVEVNDE